MSDFTMLADVAHAARETLIADEDRKARRYAGAASLAIDTAFLRETVRPVLDLAKDELAGAGVFLAIEEDWAPDIQAKVAAYSLRCSAGAGWPQSAATARSLRVIIRSQNKRLSVTTKPQADRDAVGTPVECEEGDEIVAAVRFAAEDFISRATAGPLMQGTEVRGYGR